jgi:hypothetical protein
MRTHFGGLIIFYQTTQCTLCSTESAIKHVDVDLSALFFGLQTAADLQFSTLCQCTLA